MSFGQTLQELGSRIHGLGPEYFSIPEPSCNLHLPDMLWGFLCCPYDVSDRKIEHLGVAEHRPQSSVKDDLANLGKLGNHLAQVSV